MQYRRSRAPKALRAFLGPYTRTTRERSVSTKRSVRNTPRIRTSCTWILYSCNSEFGDRPERFLRDLSLFPSKSGSAKFQLSNSRFLGFGAVGFLRLDAVSLIEPLQFGFLRIWNDVEAVAFVRL